MINLLNINKIKLSMSVRNTTAFITFIESMNSFTDLHIWMIFINYIHAFVSDLLRFAVKFLKLIIIWWHINLHISYLYRLALWSNCLEECLTIESMTTMNNMWSNVKIFWFFSCVVFLVEETSYCQIMVNKYRST